MLLRKIQTIFYVFPTYSGGRKILWDAITIDGTRVLDYIPEELIESRNEQQMRIRLKNGSVFQIIGSDSYDTSLVGTNPGGIVFSEYALADPRAYQYSRPILNANDGWALFISTPRGKNHLYDLYQIALDNPETWFAYKMTVEETGHIPLELIQQELDSGEMSDDLIQQEYFVSFEKGVEGSFYSKYLDEMHIRNQIGTVPWQPSLKVHTAWDLGYDDDTAIIFFQVSGQCINIIDCYAKNKVGLEHFADLVLSKPYIYGMHIAPHDIMVHELGSGMTRIEKLARLGISCVRDHDPKNGQIGLHDGIEHVRTTLPRCFIDAVMCAPLLKSLANYRSEWDEKVGRYKEEPKHDKWSHFADAFRYMAVGLAKTMPGKTAADLTRLHQEARSGGPVGNLPPIFQAGKGQQWR
jgi:hypothetical protein